MPKDASNLACEEFQSRLPELLASGADTNNHPHVKACVICRQFLRDIGAVTENARHFRFGTDVPDTDDWPGTT